MFYVSICLWALSKHMMNVIKKQFHTFWKEQKPLSSMRLSRAGLLTPKSLLHVFYPSFSSCFFSSNCQKTAASDFKKNLWKKKKSCSALDAALDSSVTSWMSNQCVLGVILATEWKNDFCSLSEKFYLSHMIPAPVLRGCCPARLDVCQLQHSTLKSSISLPQHVKILCKPTNEPSLDSGVLNQEKKTEICTTRTQEDWLWTPIICLQYGAYAIELSCPKIWLVTVIS